MLELRPPSDDHSRGLTTALRYHEPTQYLRQPDYHLGGAALRVGGGAGNRKRGR